MFKLLTLGLAVLVSACSGCAAFQPQGCMLMVAARSTDYQARGWRPVSAGRLAPYAEFVVWASPDGQSGEVWAFRFDGQDPPDTWLEQEGFVPYAACTWDGPSGAPAESAQFFTLTLPQAGTAPAPVADTRGAL